MILGQVIKEGLIFIFEFLLSEGLKQQLFVFQWWNVYFWHFIPVNSHSYTAATTASVTYQSTDFAQTSIISLHSLCLVYIWLCLLLWLFLLFYFSDSILFIVFLFWVTVFILLLIPIVGSEYFILFHLCTVCFWMTIKYPLFLFVSNLYLFYIDIYKIKKSLKKDYKKVFLKKVGSGCCIIICKTEVFCVVCWDVVCRDVLSGTPGGTIV